MPHVCRHGAGERIQGQSYSSSFCLSTCCSVMLACTQWLAPSSSDTPAGQQRKSTPAHLDVPFTARRARSQTPFTEGFRSKEMSLRCVQGLIPRSDYSRDPTERHHRAMCTILNCSAWRSLHRAPLDIKHDRTSSLIQALSMSPSHATPRTVASV